MVRAARLTCALVLVLLAAAPAGAAAPAHTTSTDHRPLPPPVQVPAEPQGVTLGDPTFTALPGATADFGRLGGAVYRIEMPHRWNGRLVLWMHGFEEFATEAQVSAPDIRRYLIGQGYAWGASSFSSTSQIPGLAADETAALWDYFATKYGRPTRTYITGLSMGGAATHIAAERYATRFDGALALCGNAGQTPGLRGLADYLAAAAYVAGVTQADFDASGNPSSLISNRILPALRDRAKHKRFEDIMLDLTGGPRAYGREGFRIEEETNWRRAALAVPAGLLPNRDTKYRLGPTSTVATNEFNRAVIRFTTDDNALREFTKGNEITGRLRMPLLSLHSTGDGQVPINQAQILQRRVDASGAHDLLVQRVIGDAGHCGFRSTEWEAAFDALVRWVEHGVKPAGTNVLVHDLRTLNRTFELAPREGSPAADAVPGAGGRVVVRGRATLDGAPFDARYLGAVVVRDGLVTPCQYTLPPVVDGRYEITVLGTTEASGCGTRGARIVLWAFALGQIIYSRDVVSWPGNGGTARVSVSFSTSAPDGAAPPTSGFAGEVFDRHGRQLPGGTRVEAYVGRTRCAVASVRRTGSYSGFSMDIVGPESVPGCERGATLTFRINGRPALDTAVNREPRGGGGLDLTLR